FPDRDEPSGILVGQRPQQHAVDDAEDRAGRADAECEGDHGRGRDAGVASQHTRGVAEIAEEVLDATGATRVARLFLDELEAAEIAQRREPGCGRRLTSVDPFRDLALDVIAQLVVHRLLDRAAANDQEEPAHPAGDGGHATGYVAATT